MKVAIVGNGAVGSALAATLNAAVVITRADLVAPSEADLYIIAVSDSAIAEVAQKLPADAIKVHTAGGVGIEGLDGVIYPLQTFTIWRRVDMKTTPLLVEWVSDRAKIAILEAANTISDKVIYATSEQRLRAHTAAVFVCNFVNHLLALGSRIVKDADLPDDILHPIIQETIAKALSVSDPAAVQTGPAMRGDRATMERHKALLNDTEREIYKMISKSILNLKNEKL